MRSPSGCRSGVLAWVARRVRASAAAAPWLGLLATTACQPPPPAPTTLNELSAWLFREYEGDQPGAMEEGLANLRTFFADVDLTGSYNDRAYGLADLTDDDLVDVVHPGRDPSLTLPVGLVAASPYTPDEHAVVIIQSDQTACEPASPNHYVRAFTDPTSPGGFPDRADPYQRTMNDIHKENLVMDIQYDMHKDFRWYELGEPGSGEWAVVGRAWIEESAGGSAGAVELSQSFSLDAFLPAEDGSGTIRYMGLWSETQIDGIGDDVIEATIKLGVHQMFNATDDQVGASL